MHSRRRSLLFLASLAPALLAGCSDSPSASVDGGAGGADGGACQGDSTPSRKLDLLFLVDNSASMGEEQASLAASFPGFLDVLSNVPGGLPDVHIGVISSSMGVGPSHHIEGCPTGGDDGALQHSARIIGCTPPAGAFISDELAADGVTRVTNYTDTLANTFTCIAQLGTGGCGFEQHLASLERALDPTNLANAGFLRPDAYLAIVILADEDDCSARDAKIFDPDDTAVTGVLGPLASFRCTEFGITCDQGNLTRSTANYTGCRPRGDSPYLYDPAHYAALLKGLKCDPEKLIVAGIVGTPTPVSVRRSGDSVRLIESCSSTASGTADPAVRLGWLLDQFPGSVDGSICQDDLSATLQSIAEKVASKFGP